MKQDFTPHSTEAEISVVGGCWIRPDALDEVTEILTPDDFYTREARLIFRTMLELRAEGKTPDPLVTRDRLKTRGLLEQVGGEGFLVGIYEAVPTAANVEQHAQVVRERSVRRSIIEVCDDVKNQVAHSGVDADEAIELAESAMFGLSVGSIRNGLTLARSMTRRVMADIMSGPARSFKTCYADLDYFLNGFRPRELTVLAARPSMGKTGMGFQMAAHAAVEENKTVAVFSLEMGAEDALKRMLSVMSGVSVTKLIQGPPNFSPAEMESIDRAALAVDRSNMFIDGTASMSGFEIRRRARRVKRQHGLDLIVVDYLQRMRGQHRSENRNVEVGQLVQDLKSTAKELECSVLCLSQLSRKVEDRADKMPLLSDLRESGDIEQEADAIIMLYRPAYYLSPSAARERGLSHTTEVSIAKNRNGPTGRFKLGFVPETASFTAYAGGLGG